MSPSESVAFEFLRVQNASEANGAGVNGSTTLEFGPGKQLAKPRLQDLWRIKPQMMQKVLSSIGFSEDKKTDFAHVNHQAKGFNGCSEASSHAEMMELFPVSRGFGSNPGVAEKNITVRSAISQTDSVSRSVPAKAPEQQSTAQLAIFYNGMVNVYDVPPEKAEAIMRFAGDNSLNKTSTPKINSCKIKQILKPLPSKPASNADNEDQPERHPVGLEIVRKLSVQRFLQKRKDRINSVAPYTTMNTATLPSKAWKDSEDQIILSLACPSQ
uniref:Tify domain-containing protein n=1 Tax=Picea sitchensis TaxID=3332 RepID=A9P1Y4_PICSI|nr:unknown [Picea sitchensis]